MVELDEFSKKTNNLQDAVIYQPETEYTASELRNVTPKRAKLDATPSIPRPIPISKEEKTSEPQWVLASQPRKIQRRSYGKEFRLDQTSY